MLDALPPHAARKLSPDGKLLLGQLTRGETACGDVSILLRGSTPFGDPERAALEQRGAEVRSIAGNIASARVALAVLPDLLALDFVTTVEISRPLQPE